MKQSMTDLQKIIGKSTPGSTDLYSSLVTNNQTQMRGSSSTIGIVDEAVEEGHTNDRGSKLKETQTGFTTNKALQVGVKLGSSTTKATLT